MINVPGFTDELAKEIELNTNGNANNTSTNSNDNDNDKDIIYSNIEETEKSKWLLKLQKNDEVDVRYIGKNNQKRWYTAKVTKIEFKTSKKQQKQKQKKVKTQKTQKTQKKQKKQKKHQQPCYDYEEEKETDKKGKENLIVYKWTIHVEYRTWCDKDTLNMLNSNDNKINLRNYKRIDPPYKHGNESTACQAWRHNLKKGSQLKIKLCDEYDNNSFDWYNGTVLSLTKSDINVLCNENGCCFKRSTSRWDKMIDSLEEKRRDTQRQTWANFAWSFFGFDSTNNNNCSNIYKYNKNFGNSFYDAWLYIIFLVHLKSYNSSFKPSAIYNKMVEYNEKLGDGNQHDSLEALTIILYGVNESLPNKFQYNSNNKKNFYQLSIKNQSIYDNNFEWDIDKDYQICSKLIKNKKIDFGIDLVSKYFQGIEKTEETCLNCGFHRHLYNTFDKLYLPISKNKTFNIILYYYSTKNNEYTKLSFEIPLILNIYCLKFLSLCEMYNKCDMWNKLSKFRLIMVNKNANNNNLSYILNDNQRISNYYGKYKDMTFLIVPIIRLKIGNTNNCSNNIDNEIIYTHLINNKVQFFVLSLSDYIFTHKSFKLQLIWNKIISNNNNDNNNFISYYNNCIYDFDEDTYRLCKENNIIFGQCNNYFSDETKQDNCDNNNKSASNVSLNKKIIACASARLINDLCKIGNSQAKLETFLENEISYLESIININNNNNSSISSNVLLMKLTKNMNDDIDGKTLKKGENDNRELDRARLEKCKYLHSQLTFNIKNTKFKFIQNIDNILDTFVKNYSQSVLSNNKRYYNNNTNKSGNSFNTSITTNNNNNNNSKYYTKFNSLDECLEHYYGIQYVSKKDLTPNFVCQCKHGNTSPLSTNISHDFLFVIACVCCMMYCVYGVIDIY